MGSVKSDHAAQKWSRFPEFMGGVHLTLNHSTLRTTPIQLLPRSLQEASQDTDARVARGSGIVSDGA